jgi:hypothetical protein
VTDNLPESNNSANRRARQSVINLALSLAATVGVVLLLVMGVPRDDSSRLLRIDYVAEAASASATVGKPLVAPEIPEGWWSNSARLEESDGVTSWYVGFVTPNNQYIGIRQTYQPNPTWVALQLSGNGKAETRAISNLTWEYWPTLNPSNPPGTRERAMLHQADSLAVIVFGTADWPDLESIAELIAEAL